MFEHLDTSSEKKLRKSLGLAVGTELKHLRSAYPDIESATTLNTNYEFLASLRLSIYDDSTTLFNILEKCHQFTVNLNQPGYEKLQSCIAELTALSQRDECKSYFTATSAIATPVTSASNKASASITIGPTLFTARSIDESLKNKLARQVSSLDDVAVSKDDLVCLIMASAGSEIPEYHGYFIQASKVMATTNLNGVNELPPSKRLNEVLKRENAMLFAEVGKIIDACKASDIQRVQIIFKFGEHYTPVDIDIASGSCFIIDAAADGQHMRLRAIGQFLPELKRAYDISQLELTLKDQKIRGGIQKDKYSCHLFALDHSLEVARMPNIHQQLIQLGIRDNDFYRLEWTMLPPILIKNSQSTTLIQYYMSVNPNSRDTLDALTNHNDKNYAITQVENIIARRIQTLCDALTDDELSRKIATTRHNLPEIARPLQPESRR